MKASKTGRFLLISQTGLKAWFCSVAGDWRILVVQDNIIGADDKPVRRFLSVRNARRLYRDLVLGCGYTKANH